MTKTVVSNTEAIEKIRNEESFRNRTTPDADGIPTWWSRGYGASLLGLLPLGYHADARAARYVIYSYSTPIAWVRQDGTKVIPDIGYSPTTGEHQMSVMKAWGLPVRFPARGRMVCAPVPMDIQYGRARRLRRGGLDGLPDADYCESPDAMHWSPEGS